MTYNDLVEAEVRKFWEMLHGAQFVQGVNSFIGKLEVYPEAITDMEETIRINGEFEKKHIEDGLRGLFRTIRDATAKACEVEEIEAESPYSETGFPKMYAGGFNAAVTAQRENYKKFKGE